MEKLPRLPKFPGSSDDHQLQFVVCGVCGQRFDTHDPDQIVHHGPEPHQPLEMAPTTDDA